MRDFHSFRVTWVTLALTAGVPLELVQKVTGHKTTDIVLKHYFQPGREDFRQALQSAMPKLLTNGHKSPKDEMREVIEKLKGKGLKKTKERLLALLAKIYQTEVRLPMMQEGAEEPLALGQPARKPRAANGASCIAGKNCRIGLP